MKGLLNIGPNPIHDKWHVLRAYTSAWPYIGKYRCRHSKRICRTFSIAFDLRFWTLSIDELKLAEDIIVLVGHRHLASKVRLEVNMSLSCSIIGLQRSTKAAAALLAIETMVSCQFLGPAGWFAAFDAAI